MAGEEALLAVASPRGEWIGGTIPYFMSDDGWHFTRDRVQVVLLPDFVTISSTKLYEPNELSSIPSDYTENGFSYIVIPAFSEAHQRFAKECSSWPHLFDSPLVGWITGVALDDVGKVPPMVVHGQTGELSASKAAVMHLEFPPDLYAQANIINLFHQGKGDTLTFPSTTFEINDCFVNGQRRNFAEYIATNSINIQQPLVADYMGAMVNVCFQQIDAKAGKVALYGPVFAGVEYKFADPVLNYETEFRDELESRNVQPLFTCNCIVNYVSANLDGKKTGAVVGPVSFGEIAYMLLNQTLVYLTIENK